MCVLPVRDVRRSVHQRGDDPAKGQEGLVNVSCFPGSLVHGAGPADVLGARQVDEVELANFQHVLAVNGLLVDEDGDGKDGMRPRRIGVHLRLGGLPLDRTLPFRIYLSCHSNT